MSSHESEWVNLNPDDSQNSQFYYNQAEQQFSLSPVYKKEDLSMIINSIKSKCNYLNFDYLKNCDEFQAVLNGTADKEELKDLAQYADEEVFLSCLGKELQKENGTLKDPFTQNINLKKNLNKVDFSQALRKSIEPTELKQINMKRKNPKSRYCGEEDNKQEESDDDNEDITFKDLKKFNFLQANVYRTTNENQTILIDVQKIHGYYELLQVFFETMYQEKLSVEIINKEEEGVVCSVYVNNELMVEYDGGINEKKAKTNVAQLLLAYFCPNLLKQYQENKKSKSQSIKRIKLNNKEHNGLNLHDFNNVLKLSPSQKSEKSEVELISNESNEDKTERNYRELLPRKLNEEELRLSLDEILKKRAFTFSNFLSEMKTDIIKSSQIKDKQLIEKKTMKVCLLTLENLFKYYKMVKKQNNQDDILIFSHNQEGEFKVSIMELLENGDKTLISYGSNSFKSFALYFALNSFFELHLGGSYTSINQVYKEIKKMDKTYVEINEDGLKGEGGLDLISQDLLNEIDNYTQVTLLSKKK